MRTRKSAFAAGLLAVTPTFLSLYAHAGVITSVTTPECPKWIQPPDCENGLDVPSWTTFSLPPAAPRVADDWLCDGRPITSIEWWGSYIGWQTNLASDVPPPPDPLRPVGFAFYWFTDVPASATNFSHPGELVRATAYALNGFGVTDQIYGLVREASYCNPALPFVGPNTYEHEFEYRLTFDPFDVWNEKAGQVYWLGIQALYNLEPTNYVWGWKTTSPEWNFNDDATQGSIFGTNELHYPPPPWDNYPNPYAGQSVNMAFTLYSMTCPQRCTKWSQPPDLVLGDDMDSWTYSGEVPGSRRAEDFISDGRQITDIHWWGSYMSWQKSTAGSVTNPIAPPSGTNAPLGFLLIWNADSNCVPDTFLASVFVSMTNVHQVYYGDVTQFWAGGAFEHEYQYYVDLLDTNIVLAAPWAETNGGHYWLEIQAIFPNSFVQGGAHNGWGWKKTAATNYTGCRSVVTYDFGNTWQTGNLGEAHPEGPVNFDLAFELTTTNIPATNVGVRVAFTNSLALPPADSFHMWSTGYCGCGKQVLQASSNLLDATGWWDVSTNILPRAQNFWPASPLATQRYYRVRMIN